MSIGPTKLDQPRLLGMKREAELGEPFRQYLENAPRVVFPREDHDGVVCETYEMRATSQPRHHVLRKPLIEDHVQVDVREQRRDDAALRCAGLRILELSIDEHTRV